MSDGSAHDEDPVGFASILAGASLGLVVGAVALGIAFSAGDARYFFSSVASYLLFGALSLYPISLAIILPVLTVLRRRHTTRGTTIIALWGLTLLIAVLTVAVLGIVAGSAFNLALAVVPATLWCAATGSLGALIFAKHRRAATVITTVVVCLTLASAASFLLTR